MSYNVFGGTLNLAQSITDSLAQPLWELWMSEHPQKFMLGCLTPQHFGLPCDLYLKFIRLYTFSAPLSLTRGVFFTVRRPRSARGLGPAALWSSQRFARSSTDFRGRVGPPERERRGGREIMEGARGRELWKKKGRAEPRGEKAELSRCCTDLYYN